MDTALKKSQSLHNSLIKKDNIALIWPRQPWKGRSQKRHVPILLRGESHQTCRRSSRLLPKRFSKGVSSFVSFHRRAEQASIWFPVSIEWRSHGAGARHRVGRLRKSSRFVPWGLEVRFSLATGVPCYVAVREVGVQVLVECERARLAILGAETAPRYTIQSSAVLAAGGSDGRPHPAQHGDGHKQQ
jgi:hypothetical protein